MSKTFRPGSQRFRVISAMAEGRRLHRFQAEAIGCHALHSTISDLESTTGLRFERRTVSVGTRWGADAHVAEYWLHPDSFPLARRLLGLATPQNQPQGDEARAYLLASRGGVA